MASSIILMLLCTILTVTGLKVDRHVVRENSPAGMDCNHEQENVTRVLWKYKSTHDNITETIYDSQSNKSLRTGFEISCKHHQSFITICFLKMIQARKEDSGKYICYVGQGNDAKFDSNLLKPIIEIELVIKGPIYETIVVTKGDSVILPCEHNVNNLTRARWSHVSIQGVLTYQLYYMSWKTVSNNNYKGQCEPHQPSCNLKILQANKESAGRYICMVGESLEFEEKYGMFEMTYFIEIQLVVGDIKSTTERSPSMHSNDLHNIKCSANKSANVQCSYYWVHEIAGAMDENPYAILPVENMNSPGNYTCIAKCHVGKHKECIIKAMDLEVIQEVLELRWSGLNIRLISALIAVIFILLFILIGPRLKKIIASLNLKRRFLKRRRQVEVDEFGMTGIQTLQEEGHHPLLSSTSASLVRRKHSKKKAIEMIKELTFPLGVKEILVKRTSKHGDIVIYESKNPLHDRVLMIDEALWDTSFIESSNLETMIFNVLDCHPNPKKVLVIGRCEGRIVKTLILCGVESIDAYDMCESGQAKELYNLHCKYFPDLARYLQNPLIQKKSKKGSYIDGGVDFLKNQQNVFDVIIIRSSYKNPYNHLFSEQYLETVKSALKEEGIAVLIVSGQSVVESIGSGDFVKHDFQLLCKRLFPVVKYFRFRNFRNIDHPSCLTRGLMCGLNQGNDFVELCERNIKCI